MGILEERRIAELRYRRERNRLFVRTLFYVTSIIPALLLFVYFELLRERAIVVLGGNPSPQGQPQDQPSPRPSPPPPVDVTPRRLPQEQEPDQVVPRWQPLPRAHLNSPPRRLHRNEPKTAEEPQSQTITLDLTNHSQRIPLRIKAPVRIARFDGYSHHLKPPDGTLNPGAKVVVMGPRPITLTVKFVGGSLTITPTVKTDAGDPIPFTTTNLSSIVNGIIRKGQQATSQVEALKAEKKQLVAWLNTPGPKALAMRGQVRMRVQELDHLIPEGEKVVADLKTELNVTKQLVDLADRLHRGCNVVIERVAVR